MCAACEVGALAGHRGELSQPRAALAEIGGAVGRQEQPPEPRPEEPNGGGCQALRGLSRGPLAAVEMAREAVHFIA
jgi:hypothetical protein